MISKIAQLKAHLCDEDGEKGLCVMVGKNVYEIAMIIKADEGVILSCVPLQEERPPVTNPSASDRLPP